LSRCTPRKLFLKIPKTTLSHRPLQSTTNESDQCAKSQRFLEMSICVAYSMPIKATGIDDTVQTRKVGAEQRLH